MKHERFEHLTEFLGKLAMNSGNTRNREDTYWLHDNFSMQLPFIQDGKLTPYYGEVKNPLQGGK